MFFQRWLVAKRVVLWTSFTQDCCYTVVTVVICRSFEQTPSVRCPQLSSTMYNNAPTDSVSPWLNVCTDLLLLKRSLLSLAVGRYCVSVFLLYLVSSPVSCQQLRNRAPSTGQVSPGPTWLATGKCFRADRPAVVEPHRTRDAQSQCHCTRIPGNERREGSNELM